MESFLAKLDRLINDNLSNLSFDVNELARLAYMSRPTLYRRTEALSPRTPHEMITEARMHRAAELLSSSEYTINEIALLVGYHSRSNFGKAFHGQFRMTPTEFRERQVPAAPAGFANSWRVSTPRYSSRD